MAKSSQPVLHPCIVIIHIQGPCLPLYGLCIWHVAGLQSHISLVLLLLQVFFNIYFCHSVASLSIFFFLYFQADCSSELPICVPPPLLQPHLPWLSNKNHSYRVQAPFARVKQHLHSYFMHAGKTLEQSSFICTFFQEDGIRTPPVTDLSFLPFFTPFSSKIAFLLLFFHSCFPILLHPCNV